MNSDTPFCRAPSRPERSAFVTALAWLVVGLGALALPVSGMTLLMVVARSHGTDAADAAGFFTVVVAPPLALLAGIGLLRRRSWGWAGVLVLLAGLIAHQAHELGTRRPTDTVTLSPDGVRTTVLASGSNHHSMPIIVVSALVLAKLLSRSVRSECGMTGKAAGTRGGVTSMVPRGDEDPRKEHLPPTEGACDWRVGHQGRDRMYYEERQPGGWQRLDLDGEMLMGPSHHVIYFASPARWLAYPEWARHRRGEIIARIQSEFRPPDYEYHGEGSDGTAVSAGVPSPRSVPAGSAFRVSAKQWVALCLVMAILLGITAGLGWFVKRGLETGTTHFPSKHPSQQRSVSRAAEPATFWLVIGVYSALAAGSGGLALWGLRQVLRR
ncbi:MAG: hypothetical protein IT576_21435 [Verrucomicrobiales bacterium]|nr:hypothetical protein [Verrucomicrobiales bacterium]